MDRATFDARVYELIGRMASSLPAEVDRLARSGGIDIENADDNYIAPKIVFQVALENFAANVGGMAEHWQDAVQNLRHF